MTITQSGHRRYDTEHDVQIELIQCGKIAGLSLDQITVMLHGLPSERAPLLRRRLAELERSAMEVEASKRLLGHALGCEAPTSCPECAHPQGSFDFPD